MCTVVGPSLLCVWRDYVGSSKPNNPHISGLIENCPRCDLYGEGLEGGLGICIITDIPFFSGVDLPTDGDFPH